MNKRIIYEARIKLLETRDPMMNKGIINKLKRKLRKLDGGN